RVALAAVVQHAGPDAVELPSDLLDVGLGEVGDRVVGLLGDRRHRGLLQWSIGVDQWSRWQAPAAELMQVWILMPPGSVSPGTAVVTAPSRRSRTEPSLSGRTQPMQMPIRHPLGISTPASSAAS